MKTVTEHRDSGRTISIVIIDSAGPRGVMTDEDGQIYVSGGACAETLKAEILRLAKGSICSCDVCAERDERE